MAPTDQPAVRDGVPRDDHRGRWRWVGFVVSAVLMGAAVWAVRTQWGSLTQVAETARGGQWRLAGAAVALPVFNWILTSGVFYFLMNSGEGAAGCGRRHVPLGEMTLLIGSAWLLNYLPLSPGMFGRVAYHRAVHRVPVIASIGVLVAALVIGIVVVGAVLAVVVAAGRSLSAQTYAVLLGAPVVMLAGLAWAGARLRPAGRTWRYAAAAALRWLDVVVWMARYFVVFELLGRRLTLPEAAAIAAASQAAMQVPLIGNGLGVREWAVGLVGPVLPPWMSAGSAGLSRGLGLSADLLNRGFELIAALPVGLACTAALARRQARA
jgi:hypothetical protein